MGKIEDELIQTFQNMDEFTMPEDSVKIVEKDGQKYSVEIMADGSFGNVTSLGSTTLDTGPERDPSQYRESALGKPAYMYSTWSEDAGQYYDSSSYRKTGQGFIADTFDGGQVRFGYKEGDKARYASPTDLKVGEWVLDAIFMSFGAGAAKAFMKLPQATRLAQDVYRGHRSLDDIFAKELKNYKLPPYKGLPKGKGREGLPSLTSGQVRDLPGSLPASASSSVETGVGDWLLRFMRPTGMADNKIPLGMNKAQWTKYVSNPKNNPGVSWKVWEDPRLFNAYKMWEKYLGKDLPTKRPGPISGVLEEGKDYNIFG